MFPIIFNKDILVSNTAEKHLNVDFWKEVLQLGWTETTLGSRDWGRKTSASGTHTGLFVKKKKKGSTWQHAKKNVSKKGV